MAQAKPSNADKGKGQLKWVLLALTGVLAAVAIYLFKYPAEYYVPPPSQTDAGKTLAQEVLQKAQPLLDAHQYAPARDLMLAYVRSYPNDVEVRPTLAQAQMALGQYEQAEKTIDDAIRLSPLLAKPQWRKGQLVRRRGGSDYLSFYRNAAERCTDATPEIWSSYGLELLDVDRVDEASKWLDKAQAAGVRDAPTLTALAKVAMARKQWDKAQPLLRQAIEQESANVWLYAMLAETQKNAGQLEAAARTVQQALRVKADGELFMLLGSIRTLQDRRSDAADAYAQAARFKSYQLAGCLEAARQYYLCGKYALAMEQIDTASQLAPIDAQVVQLKKEIEDARFVP